MIPARDGHEAEPRVSEDGGPGLPEISEAAYAELRGLAGRYLGDEREDHTLSATELVHEACLRLKGLEEEPIRFRSLVARAMRRILVDHARRVGRKKRGGGWRRVTLGGLVGEDPDVNVDLLELDDALRELASLQSWQAEIVELKFFGGMTTEAIARRVGVSPRTVEADWAMARAWLRRRLTLRRG